ncbi:(4Fe-4S)-binding protein [Aeromicrobium sp. CFBP 8757]|uniref:(4Fe-4S)-binding protein n=1 Tax=Aeromicrobium sp. CFBP 8757 TaxID=2775288 RepID=UPI00178536B4|nr:(4Fe-4S)-binding protein [Aeromicrobium sp. CFBP 8757]MBD8605422.1 (4Fe-4S)-binding protein [Aeromicrobium sp. CFBP 8757]
MDGPSPGIRAPGVSVDQRGDRLSPDTTTHEGDTVPDESAPDARGTDPGSTRRTYVGTAIDVSFDAALCRHAAACVRGLPEVFDTAARPWIRPDAADATRVAEVVARCPSGALRSRMHNPSP